MFPVKHRLNHNRDVLAVRRQRERERAKERGGWKKKKKKTPDTSDATSQPVKEESERAAKPFLPTAACKVEILPFTFGQMRGSRCGVCVCVCV